MKGRNRPVTRFFCLVMTVLLICTTPICQTTEVNAASGASWRNAYESILNNWKRAEKYCNTSYLKTYFGRNYKFNQYFLYDLNRNGIPELFLHSSTMDLTLVFTYNGKLISLGYYDIYGFNTGKHELLFPVPVQEN